jgi:hypothetical protein
VVGRVRIAEVSRGRTERPSGALAMDTRDLAEGMPLSEWKERREKAWREVDHKTNKEILRS